MPRSPPVSLTCIKNITTAPGTATNHRRTGQHPSRAKRPRFLGGRTRRPCIGPATPNASGNQPGPSWSHGIPVCQQGVELELPIVHNHPSSNRTGAGPLVVNQRGQPLQVALVQLKVERGRLRVKHPAQRAPGPSIHPEPYRRRVSLGLRGRGSAHKVVREP